MTPFESEPMTKIRCAIKGCFHMPYVGTHPGLGLITIFMIMPLFLAVKVLSKDGPVLFYITFFLAISLFFLGILLSGAHSRFEISAKLTRQFRIKQLALAIAEMYNKKGVIPIKILVENGRITHNFSHPDIKNEDITEMIKDALTFEGTFPQNQTYMHLIKTKGGHSNHQMMQLMSDVFVRKTWLMEKDPHA